MNFAKNSAGRAAAPIRMDSSGPRRPGRLAAVSVPGLILAGLLSAGCGAPRTPPPVQTTADGQQAESDPAAVDAAPSSGNPAESTARQIQQNTTSTPDAGAIADSSADAGPDEPLVLAPVGPQDARRGKSIAGGGIITEPIRQNFLIRHRIAFLNLKNTEKIYNATEGRMPESHDEYMTEIVEKGGIQLPELDPGWDYYYDATDQTLKQRKVQ